MKIPIFFLARTIESWVKWMLDSQKTFKIKLRLRWTILKFCLRQQLFAFKEFCVETRLSNIFKTTNVTNFTKAILKSHKSSISYIQIENTKTTRPLFKGSWVLLYFWHSNWHYFGYISGKVAKPHFLESPQKSLKTRQNSYQ